MTGCSYTQAQYYDFLFAHLFEDNINSWLWFHLKLASFEFKQPSPQASLLDYSANKLPHFYKPYFLEDLVQEVTDDRFVQRIWVPELPSAENEVRLAKILFYVGEFQYGINKLLRASHVVEATIIGLALSELSMLATKQSLFDTVRSQD